MVRKITKWEIMGCYLNDYSRRHYLRELADLLKKSHQSIKPYVEELTKESILIRYDRKNLVEYGLNLKDRRTYDYLIISEKERLIKRLEEDTYLRTLFEKLSPYFRDNTFIIFGSASERLQKGSDIDLCLIAEDEIVKREIKSILKITPINVDLQEFSSQEFLQMLKSKENNVGNEIVKNNVILYGLEQFYKLVNNVKQ